MTRSSRKISLIVLILAVITAVGWFFYHFSDHHEVEDGLVSKEVIYPERGVITDRHGNILAGNETTYDLVVVPAQVGRIDTTLFCRLLGISIREFNRKLGKARAVSVRSVSLFQKNIPARQMMALRKELVSFPGFFERARTVRCYPDSVAAQALGFVSMISPQAKKGAWGYSRPGEPAGRWGLERMYDSVLRGHPGMRFFRADSNGRRYGILEGGTKDVTVVPGRRLVTGIDLALQKFAAELMKNKIGSIVAIDPRNGEVLAYLSSPSYDPNLLSGPAAGSQLLRLRADSDHVLMSRPVRSRNAPGSSLKPVLALAALQQGIIKPADVFFCPQYYLAGERKVACEHFDGRVNLRKAIAQSCNTYFCNVFARQLRANNAGARASYEDWRKQLLLFGLGGRLGIDLPNELGGQVPESAVYDKIYGPGWSVNDIISLGIGQGELEVTPLQLANTQCIIANRGYYYTPHLVKDAGPAYENKWSEKHIVPVDAGYFDPVIDGMQDAVENGTAAGIRIPGLPFCGKTGTVENTRGKSHSVFAGFAPRKNPSIAIAVIIENAGYGASYAAPVASYLIEKYLTGKITKPADEVKWMMEQNLMRRQ